MVHRTGEPQYTTLRLTTPQVVNFSRHVIRLTSATPSDPIPIGQMLLAPPSQGSRRIIVTV